MSISKASLSTRYRVGIFTVLALVLVGAITVFVNDKPFWWRPCQLVYINIDDATGLKSKSPIRSLGLQIGYLSSIDLYETYVRLGICITAPAEVLPSTRAFIRGEGFLGDKFVELKPIKFVGPREGGPSDRKTPQSQPSPGMPQQSRLQKTLFHGLSVLSDFVVPEAYGQVEQKPLQQAPVVRPDPRNARNREIPVGQESQDVQQVVTQVNDLVTEMTALTNNLKQAIDPQELRQTMTQLNKTLENASRVIGPEGGLNTTAQRTLAKLEDAIEQLRDQMSRMNRGEGSLGMVLNDPKYAEELHETLKNANRLLSKVGGVRFFVDVGAEQVTGWNGGRGWFRLSIWPAPNRYYLLGVSVDPRGTRKVNTTSTTAGGQTTVLRTENVDPSGLLFTAMLGKVVLRRIDLSAGALHSDGAVSLGLRLGPWDREDMLVLRSDIYVRGSGIGLDGRLTATLKPWSRTPLLNPLYIRGGMESVRYKVNGDVAYFFGAGITFEDEDIKILFTLR